MATVMAMAPQATLRIKHADVGVRDMAVSSSSRSFFAGAGSARLAVLDLGLRGTQAVERPGPIRAALFPFLQKKKDKEVVKKELLEAIAPLDRGAAASADDIARVDAIARELESLNPTKDPLKSTFLNGKWELLYTTSSTILKKERPKVLRPNGAIYQAINTDTLRAQNQETWPYFNQVTANLEPVNNKKVIVNFDYFKIGGLISIKAPGRAQGELTITYLDDELRVSRGTEGTYLSLSWTIPLTESPFEFQ